MPNAKDHVVIVGGTSGIGLSLARAANALGCKLTVTGRGALQVAETAKSVGSDVTGCHLDLDDASSIEAALKDGPPIDHLALLPLHQVATTVKDFNVAEANKLLHIKLTGYLKTVSTVVPRLKPTSSIVVFGGLAKERPYPTSTMVTVANAGITGIMRTLAVELAPVRVNSVSPGLVGDSPKWDAIVKKGQNPVVNAMTSRTPTKRLASINDVISGVFFLMDNSSVNGVDLAIDGGIRLV